MGDINNVISVDAGPGVAGLREFTDALEQASSKWAEFQAKMSGGLGGSGADKLAASMDAAAAKIGEAADKAAASLERIGEASSGAAGGVERMGEAAAGAGGSLDEAAAGADAAAAASDRLAASADEAAGALDRQAVSGKAAGDSAEGSAAASEGFGKTAKVAFLGLAVAAGYGIDKAMKYQSEMLLLHTQAGVSSQDTAKMSQGVLQISTQTGQSLDAVAESAYHVASNMESMKGASPAKMLAAVKIAAEGASVGHSNLVDTTTALTSVLASGIPGAQNYSQAMGALNSTVGSGEMNMQQLAEALGTGVVPIVKGYGLTLKDTGAALATYGDLNIRGAKAGTELRMAVQGLAQPGTGKAAVAMMKELGLSSRTLSNDMQSGGLLKALDDLQSRFKAHGITAKNEGGALLDLFTKKSGAGLALLMENMDRFRSKFPAITADANNFGKAWQATQASPAQKWKEAVAGLQASAVGFGTELLPPFTAALGVVDKILAAINGSKGAATGIAVAFGGLAALFTGKKLVSGIEGAFQTGETVLKGIGKVSQVLNIPGLSKLANIGQGATGAAALDTSAANLDGAAEALSGAAEKLSTGGLGGTAGKAEGAAAGAEGAAGAGEGAAAGEAAGATAGMFAAPLLGAGAGLALGLYLNKYEKYDHPAPAAQQGPHAPAVSSQAWEQYDAPSAAAPSASFTNTLAQAMGKPVKVAPPDLAALDSAKAKAKSAGDGIWQSVETALSKPVKAAAPNLAAYEAAKGKATADGAAIDAGLAQGINANSAAAVSAAQNVASQVEAAMNKSLQISSPSKVTQKIGASAVDGLVTGLEGGQAAVTAAAQALGQQTAKAADVTAIQGAITKGITDAGSDSGLVKYLKADQGKLLALSAQRQQLETEITDSEQIATSAIQSASIMNAANATPYDPSQVHSSYALVQGMQYQAQQQSMFLSTIQSLQKSGLNATTLNQLVQAGPSSLPTAQGIQQGGKGTITQLNQIESQIRSSASKLGDIGAPAMYQAGVQAGQGLAEGLKSSLSAVNGAISLMASTIVATIKKDLKISSPSQVFAGLGMTLPQGLAQGVDAGSAVAEAAVGRLGQRTAGAFHPGVSRGHDGAFAGGGGGGGNVTIINNTTVTVQGSVTTENDLLSKLQAVQLKKANANWQGGWQLPGRKN